MPLDHEMRFLVLGLRRKSPYQHASNTWHAREQPSKKLNAAGDTDAIVKIEKEADFSISADELKQAQSVLSEDERKRTASPFEIFFRHLTCFRSH